MGHLTDNALVTGAKGMLGSDLVALLNREGARPVAVDLEELDICDLESVQDALRRFRPKLVFNCAAFTDVDGCETRREEAFRVNAQGPENLARACSQEGIPLFHVSTDYVFDGSKDSPYSETDPINPLGVYGKTKAAGEEAVRKLLPELHCIVRTQWLFGLNGRNFVEAILRNAEKKGVLSVVDDQYGCPTYTPDLASALIRLARMEARGTYHVTNSEVTTWHGFACRIVETSGLPDVRIEPITTEALGRKAPRPKYSALDCSRFRKTAGYSLRNWKDALNDYLDRRR